MKDSGDYQGLWRAVISDAVRESVRFAASDGEEGGWKASIQYLLSDSMDVRMVMDYAGMDYDYFRPRFITLLALYAKSTARNRIPVFHERRLSWKKPSKHVRLSAKEFLQSPMGLRVVRLADIPRNPRMIDDMLGRAAVNAYGR